MELERWDDASEALAHFGGLNSSSMEACVRQATVCRRKQDKAGEKSALDEADNTWRQLPGFLRRQQLGWWLRGKSMRVV